MESEGTGEASRRWRWYHSIEFPIFLSICAVGMTGTILSDLILYQSCREILGKSHYNTCQLLHTNSSSQAVMDLDKLIQPHASYILLCKSLIEGILPAFLCLFFGPWSDKYGRKPIMIAALVGFSLTFTILSVMSNWNINPWFYLFAFIPPALLGGTAGLMLSIFCYVSDITNNDNRAWRLASVESSLAVGLVSGTFIGPLIFQKWGYTTLFATAAFILDISVVYILIWIPESLKNPSTEKWRNPFDFLLVKELIQTGIKKRQGLSRFILWCGISILSLYVITINGEMNMSYLFANARLGWNAAQYSYFSGIAIAVTIVGTILGIKILKFIGFAETSIAIVGALSAFSASMATAFVYKSWHMYMTIGIGILSGLISPPIRSILSKSVSPEDIGKVFSLTTAIETILPMGTGSLYTFIYSHYMPPVYPSPTYLLSAAFFLSIMIMITIMDRAKSVRDNASYDSLIEEN